MALSKGYHRYMKSDKWFSKRSKILKRDNYQCQYCPAVGTELHVHHLTYKRFMREKNKDLVTACPACHNLLDKIRKTIKNLPDLKQAELDAIKDFYGYPHDMPKDREVLRGFLITLENLEKGR